MTATIRFHRPGGPEVLVLEEMPLDPPGPGQVTIEQSAVGLNFIDVYHRTGLYPVGPLPSGLGSEGAGRVVALGDGVSEFKVGDRVAYAGGPVGAYAAARNLPASVLVPLPASIDDRQAAAMMLQGLTAHYLLRSTFPVQPGQTILFHAAAGGVGLIACQWARHLGARVIGTVGSPKKAELALAHGAAHVIDTSKENIVERVRALTGGEGVPVVYDSIGRDSFAQSLDCLAPRGMLVLFGQSSGTVPPFDLSILAAKGSLYVTRPSLRNYTANRAELLARAAELFELVGSGVIRIEINQTYRLDQAAEAHADLESRRTTGSSVLIP